MTSEAQRIAIAEYLGWKRADFKADKQFGNIRIERWRGPSGEYWSSLPDWPNDLDACHEMEKAFKTTKEIHRYQVAVFNMFGNRHAPTVFQYLHATAAQRAEAFLKTIGKWVE